MKRTNIKTGFTIVELTIALAIISVLIIFFAFLINGIISAYIKGTTIKDVNNVGRELVEEFSTAITSSQRKQITDICATLFVYDGSRYNACKNDGAYRYVYSERYNPDGKPISGVFCTGYYSYIWNTGYAVANSDDTRERPALVRYSSPEGSDLELKDFRLIKIVDQSNIACLSRTKNPSTGEPENLYELLSDGNPIYDLTHDSNNIEYALPSSPEELIYENHANLILYDLEVFRPAQAYPTFHSYYTGHFVLGTIGGGVDILSNGDYCKPPADYDSDFNYCSVNKFNFAAETIGG